MSDIGTADNPLRAAIIGSGPAGFYAAESLLANEDVTVAVDMFDRLPTPFGLVRAGVAPDHPKIKNVIRRYEKTAASEGFRFFGNVEVGREISPADLAERYHAVLYAYGSSTDRKLGIPGEDLPGSHAATEFVAWYNAHPDFADHEFDLSCERVVVIGNGNVAADVARMLALTRDELEETDTADHAIEAMAESGVREIVVLGRRGPAQAAFTNPEVRELGEMVDADVYIDPADCELDEASRAYLESDEADMTARKNVDIFTDFSQREPEGKRRRIVLRFLSSPVEIKGDGKVESIVIGRNELVEGAGGRISARDTGEREELDCGLVFRSIGYKGIGLEGIPFDDDRGVIRNEGRPDHGRRRRPGRGPVRRRLDQARPQRRHRDEQEGRPGDDRPPVRGRGHGSHDRARRRPRAVDDRGAPRRTQPRHGRHLRGLGGDRRGREGQGRAAGTPPREVLPDRRDARRVAQPDSGVGFRANQLLQGDCK